MEVLQTCSWEAVDVQVPVLLCWGTAHRSVPTYTETCREGVLFSFLIFSSVLNMSTLDTHLLCNLHILEDKEICKVRSTSNCFLKVLFSDISQASICQFALPPIILIVHLWPEFPAQTFFTLSIQFLERNCKSTQFLPEFSNTTFPGFLHRH